MLLIKSHNQAHKNIEKLVVFKLQFNTANCISYLFSKRSTSAIKKAKLAALWYLFSTIAKV